MFEDGEYIFSPFHWRTHIYHCILTGKMKFTRWQATGLGYNFYQTDEEKAAEDEELRLHFEAQAKKRKPRKPYKWSTAAKVRNRQRRLRKRIEKQFGYDPNRPDLFDGDTLLAIESEFHDRIHDNPDYFIHGKNTWRVTRLGKTYSSQSID